MYDRAEEFQLRNRLGQEQIYVNPEAEVKHLKHPRSSVQNRQRTNSPIELHLGTHPLVGGHIDVRNQEMDNAARSLRDSLMGLNQEQFSGNKGEDPNAFFVRIDRQANFSGWNDDRKLHAVFLALRGTASDFAETLPAAVKANYEDLKEAITNHFKINKSKVLQWEEIQRFALKDGQSVTSYYDELRKLATSLGGISDEQLLVMFQRGLPRDLKIQVMAKEPRTLNEGLEAARLFEGMLDVVKDNNICATNPFRRDALENSYVSRHLEAQISSLADQVGSLKSQKENSLNSQIQEQLTKLSLRIEEIAERCMEPRKNEADPREHRDSSPNTKGDWSTAATEFPRSTTTEHTHIEVRKFE